jgi:hypothetical protein
LLDDLGDDWFLFFDFSNRPVFGSRGGVFLVCDDLLVPLSAMIIFSYVLHVSALRLPWQKSLPSGYINVEKNHSRQNLNKSRISYQ